MLLLAFMDLILHRIPVILNLPTTRIYALIYFKSQFDNKTKDCQRSGSFQHKRKHSCFPIDPFTDTGAIIFKYFDFRSIMRCSAGMSTIRCTQLVLEIRSFTVFLGKMAIIITSKHGTVIFFPITILFYLVSKVKEKIPRKALVSVKRSILMFVNFHNQPPLNKFL